MLSIRNLVVKYGSSVVLDLDEFDTPMGELHAVTGPNGSGKSTLLKCIAGLIPAESGQITFHGRSINEPGSRSVGILLQRPVLLSGTVEDNIAFGLKCHGIPKHQRQERVQAALKLCRLEHLTGKNRRHLSGGEIQRVALARTLVLAPEILLLDEPFSHLDQDAADLLLTIIREIQSRDNTTILLATHDIHRGYALADRVLSLVHGKRVPSVITNILRGDTVEKDGQYILTTTNGQIIYHTSPVIGSGAFHVEPGAITLAESRHKSTARNQMAGTVTAIVQKDHLIRVDIDTGIQFSVFITPGSCQELAIQPGKEIWISFKASSVKMINLFNSKDLLSY